MAAQHLLNLIGISVFSWISLYVYRLVTLPLSSIPGPFLARFNRLWYLNRVRKLQFHREAIELHQKYGPVVRLAPDMYSIDDPAAIKQIYGAGSHMTKADMYNAFKHPDPKNWTLFADQDIKRAQNTRKILFPVYSMSSQINYEPYVDECASIFKQRLDEFAAQGQPFDMGHWLQCYAFDVIGSVTYRNRFGFLDKGEDICNLITAMRNAGFYGSLVGPYTNFHSLLWNIGTWLDWKPLTGRVALLKWVQKQLKESKEIFDGKQGAGEKRLDMEEGPKDFTTKLLETSLNDPENVTQYHVFIMGLANIVAGSDTTGSSLSAMLYHLIRNPSVMKTLRKEIEAQIANGMLNSEIPSFREVQELPYLQAVMKEAIRIHPSIAFPLWRTVPEGGSEICGRFFPAGTTVGVNQWSSHHNKEVFGEDADKFRPERWLEAEREGGKTLHTMNEYFFPFGLGSRTCLGRHIAWLEMSKLLPQLVREYDYELVHADRDWECEGWFFVKPLDFEVVIKRRRETSITKPSMMDIAS